MAILNWRDHPRLRFVDFPPAAVNKGAVFIALDLNDSAWISDGTTYYPIGDQGLSAPNFGEYTWATKPAADSLPVRSRISVPEWNNSEWYTDGTYWRPVGGRAVMRNWIGANVTHSAASITIVAGVPGLLLPADLVATPGLSMRNRVMFHREAEAAAASQTANIRIGIANNSRQFGNLNLIGATANQKWLIDETRTVNTGLTTFSQASGTTGQPSAVEPYDPIPLSNISNQTLIISGYGVDTGGSDVWYFDQWLTEIYA